MVHLTLINQNVFGREIIGQLELFTDLKKWGHTRGLTLIILPQKTRLEEFGSLTYCKFTLLNF